MQFTNKACLWCSKEI